MKIKFDKFSFDFTDKDFKNFTDFMTYFNSLSNIEQIKTVSFILGGALVINEMVIRWCKTFLEHKEKMAKIESETEMEMEKLKIDSEHQ